jgi:hypothetical protein
MPTTRTLADMPGGNPFAPEPAMVWCTCIANDSSYVFLGRQASFCCILDRTADYAN